MPRLYRQGDEPVSGYRLQRQLGRGGLGEVWQAASPAGTEVAFKIVDVSDRLGIRQWRALQKLKKIRHPNLVPILSLWLRDEFGDLLLDTPGSTSFDQAPAELYLATGLGEKSLLDRLKECKEEGEQGIPVGELLTYLEDAGRGLDHLNSPKHELQAGPESLPHGNLKPQNILIVGDAAQVADFGLNALLGPAHASKQASLSTAFTAPEILEGQGTAATSDQYSLAVIYCYLRTGLLPYSRNDPDTILLEALEGRLDLTKLSPAEQEVIRQATSLKPSSRFATCQDMARELRRAVESAGTATTTLVVEPGSEAVPGHKLVRCLGRGAYGEVWEALAPGRVPVALKIIRDLDRAGGRGKQEYKALELIQRVTHNNLMELRAYWLLDKHGQVIPDEIRGRPGTPTPTTLIIASKLADKNLSQLLDEFLAHGHVGIPPLLLLDYLKQVALALDYLNSPRHKLGDRLVSIQHRDIKPDNIMLAGDVAKLTDFGLAKVVELEDTSAEIHQDSVGFTFHYAAPEVLRGRVTKWSDQYALAITYHYLRTGLLPYDKVNSAYELMMQQLEGRLDLSYLPEAERRVVARATSVIPEKRFHTCTAFIESLEMAIPADGQAPLAKAPPARQPGVLGLAGGGAGRLKRKAAAEGGLVAVAEGSPNGLPPEGNKPDRGTHHRQPIRPEDEAEHLSEAVQELEGEPLPALLKRRSTMNAIGLPNELPNTEDEIANLEEALAARPALGAPPRANGMVPGAEVQIQPVMSPALMKELREGQKQRGRRTYWPLVLAGCMLVAMVAGALGMLAIFKPRATQVAVTPTPTRVGETPVGGGSAAAETKPAQGPVNFGPNLTELPNPLLPIPPSQTHLVLGRKDPADSDLPSWLNGELDKLIAQVEKPADFAAAQEGLKPVPPAAVTGKLQAFRAEALLEGPVTDVNAAARLADEALGRGDAPAYAKYVRARAFQQQREPAKAVRLLGEAVEQDVSLHGLRKERAATIFSEGLAGLNVTADPKKLTATTTATADDLRWLRASTRFGDMAQVPAAADARLHLFLLNDNPRQHLAELRAPAARQRLRQRKQGGMLLASILQSSAAQHAERQPELAVQDYAELANLLRQEPGLNEMPPLELYQRVIKPGLDLESRVDPRSREGQAALGQLHAAKGRLIWENPYETWPFGESPYREAAKSYERAVAATPKPNPLRAEYFTWQGLCLTRLGFDKLSPEDWQQLEADAREAVTENPNYPGGWNLRGIVCYHQALRQPTAEGVQTQAREAVEAYDKAIQLAKAAGQGDENLFFYFNNRSVANVLLASYANKEERKQRLEQARQDAEQATKLASESELAWSALGIALENLAWKGYDIGQTERYPEAEAAFSRQIQLRPAEADGHLNRGRLLAKWILDDGGPASKLPEAERDLNEGIRRDSAGGADGWFWLGRIRLKEEKLPDAVAAFENAVKPAAKSYANLSRIEPLLLPKHPKEMRQVLSAALPADVEQCQARHAGALLMRGNMVKEHFKDELPAARADCDLAAKLAEQPSLKAAAYEAAAAVRFAQMRGTQQPAEFRKFRGEMIDALRSRLKVESPLPVWPAARSLATLLEAEATEETAVEKKKSLLEEALAAMRVAIDKAPAEQRAALERTRRSLQETLSRATAPPAANPGG